MPVAEYQSQLANNRQCAESNGNPSGSAGAVMGLAGPSMTEILLFSLGTQEIFGINVSNVREVCPAMHITRTPNMPAGMDGIVSLRGRIIPVLALDKLLGLNGNAPDERHTLIVAEHNRNTLGFIVHKVERIIHVGCDKVRPVEGMLSGDKNMVPAITKLSDGKLVSLLGIAQVLAGAFGKNLVGSAYPEWGGLSPCKGVHESENNKDTQSATGQARAELTAAGG